VKVSTTFILDRELHKEFKMAALKQNKSMTEIIIECIKKTIKEAKNVKV